MLRCALLVFATLLLTPVSGRAEFESLKQIATQSLESNIVDLKSGSYLQAGQHQFRSIWSRDFWGSIPGLLASGHSATVRDTLELLLRNVRSRDSLVPRLMDSTSISKRYLLKIIGVSPPLRDPLRAEYLGGNGAHQVIDSNLCVILGILDYSESTKDWSVWIKHQNTLQSLLDSYTVFLKDGLISQPPYSDWQDNVPRQGYTLYTNMMYWSALNRLAQHGFLGVSPESVDHLKAKIREVFYDSSTGLWKSIAGHPYISSDGLLMVFDYDFLTGAEQKQLYLALKRHPLWTTLQNTPGFWGYPEYPRKWSSWMSRLAGLQHYSDQLYSPTLMAWYAKIAYRQGDRISGDRILNTLERLVIRDRTVEELYEFNSAMKPFRSFLYRSEHPFSWGSAKILETLAWRSK